MAGAKAGYDEILDNSLIDGLDAIYNVHALLAAKARENPDWGHVSEWFYEYLREVEHAYLLTAGIGRASKLFEKRLLHTLEEAAREGDLAKATAIVGKLADSLPRIKTLNSIALKHLCLGRLLASALIFLGALLLATATDNIIITLTTLLLGGLGASSIILCFSPLGRGTLEISALGLLLTETYLILQEGVPWLIYSAILAIWLIVVALLIQENAITTIYKEFRRYTEDTHTNVNTLPSTQHHHETRKR